MAEGYSSAHVDTATPTKSRAVEFFGLPRELRDQIYSGLLTAEKLLPPAHQHFQPRVRNFAPRNLLLISHRFRDELLERIAELQYITFEDLPDYYYGPLALPPPLQQASYIEIDLVIECWCDVVNDYMCDMHNELGKKQRATTELLSRFPNLLSLSLNVHIRSDDNVSNCEHQLLQNQATLLSGITQNAYLKSVSVYRSEFAYDVRIQGEDGRTGWIEKWDFARDKVLVMQWSHEARELHRIRSIDEIEHDTQKVAPSEKP